MAEVVEKKSVTVFQYATDVVEKKKPLSIALRKEEVRLVVAITLPCALVERSAEVTFVSARFVVVALVPVAFPKTKLPVSVVEEKEPLEMEAPESVGLVPKTTAPVPVSSESHCAKVADDEKRLEVAMAVKPPEEFPMMSWLLEMEVSPVPPYRTPIEVVAETVPLLAESGPLREPIVAFPATRLVVEAYEDEKSVEEAFEKVCSAVKTFGEYVFAIVVEASVK